MMLAHTACESAAEEAGQIKGQGMPSFILVGVPSMLLYFCAIEVGHKLVGLKASMPQTSHCSSDGFIAELQIGKSAHNSSPAFQKTAGQNGQQHVKERQVAAFSNRGEHGAQEFYDAVDCFRHQADPP